VTGASSLDRSRTPPFASRRLRFWGSDSVSAAASAIQTRTKNGDDADDVVGEFALGRAGPWVVCVHRHGGSTTTEDVDDEVEGEPTQSITVRHVHCAYTSCKREVQKRREATAVEIDAAADVTEDALDVRVGDAEDGDLVLQVRLLLSVRDPCIDDILLTHVVLTRCRGGLDGWLSGDRGEVVEPMHSFTGSWQDEGADGACPGPLDQGLAGDTECEFGVS
jgi:hypothetical protein